MKYYLTQKQYLNFWPGSLGEMGDASLRLIYWNEHYKLKYNPKLPDNILIHTKN